jgi:hypothetical protein
MLNTDAESVDDMVAANKKQLTKGNVNGKVCHSDNK